VIALLHFCDLILFAICALSHSFLFILLVLFLSTFFLVVLFYNEIKNNFLFHFLLGLKIELLHY
jgi:hypothetical protein